MADLFCGSRVNRAIAANDATKGRDSISHMRLLIRFYEHLITGQATRVRVLDDRHCRGREAACRSQCSVEVEDIVVGEFFPMQHFRSSKRWLHRHVSRGGRGAASPAVESG